ncbi:MAG: type II toxin-antitoxin system HicB family antitoxin [Acidobacteria bacterium]|nr:type II toxin-antitoxin system HicB family antitoxin [Acidobacteriota bacterium]
MEYDVIVERDEEGYLVATVPAIPGCHTQARSLDELMERTREAILVCLEEEGEPEPTLELLGIHRIRVA